MSSIGTGTRSLSLVGPLSRVRASSSAATTPYRLSLIKLIPYATISCIAMLNLNGLAVMMIGVERLFSAIILICCLAAFAAFRFAFKESLGAVGGWFIAHLVVYLAIGTIGALDRPQSLTFSFQELGATILVVAACAMTARYCMLNYSFRGMTRWLFALSLASAGLIFVSMKTRIFYIGFAKTMDLSRYSGTFANPNESGLAMCIGLAIGFAYLIFAKRKLMVMVGIALLGMAMAASFSRSAFLVSGVVITSQIFFSPVVKRKGLALMLMTLGLALVWLVFYGAQKLDVLSIGQRQRLDYISRMLTTGEVSAAGSGRSELTIEAIEMCKSAPAFGHGLGALQKMPRTHLGAHNTYLLVMGESGLAGIAMLIAFLCIFAWEGWKCPRGPIRTFVLSYVIVLIPALISSHTIMGNRNENVMMGTCFGIIAAAKELQRRKQASAPGGELQAAASRGPMLPHPFARLA